MPTIATTTLEDLEPRLVAVIEALAPVDRYQQTTTWKHYKQSQVSPGRTRSFTVRWIPGQFIPGGYFTSPGGGGVETGATLIVVTDYAGEPERLQWLVQSDYSQLRDSLNTLTAASVTTGLVSILPSPANSPLAATGPQGRQLLSDRAPYEAPAFQTNHTFALTYQKQRHAA